MQDACRASSNAAKNNFDDTIVLMCYFHVMFNCNKHFSMLSKEEKELVLKLVRNIHMAISNY